MELRLFPLQAVLFPGMALPLQVFEERYVLLVSECLREQAPFGIALLREGAEVGPGGVPHDVGTTARIRSVLPSPGGRLRLEAVGERRFRILQIRHDRPYLRADVEYPVDEIAKVPPALLAEARERYTALLQLQFTARGEYVRRVETPETPGMLADAVGAACAAVAAEPERLQMLLEAIDVRRRLDHAIELLEETIPLAHRQASQAVALRFSDVPRLN